MVLLQRPHGCRLTMCRLKIQSSPLCKQRFRREGRSIRSMLYYKIQQVYNTVGNIFKLLEHLVNFLILTYYRNIVRVLVNIQESENLKIEIIRIQASNILKKVQRLNGNGRKLKI